MNASCHNPRWTRGVPSYVNICLVPTTPTTVIASRTMPRPGLPLDAWTRHAADVADVQLVLLHAWSDESSSDPVGVKQYKPKLSPDIVTLPVPVRTAFGGSEKLAAGAARESIRHNMHAGTPVDMRHGAEAVEGERADMLAYQPIEVGWHLRMITIVCR